MCDIKLRAKQELENISIKSFYTDYLKENLLNTRPDYQREIAWNHKDMISMLNTYMNGGFVQNFFIYKLPKRENGFKYECVDGQHRLTVIKFFMDGIIFKNDYLYWEDEITKEKVFFKITEEIKKKYKKNIRELTQEEKDFFLDTKLQYVFISDIPYPEYLREQFEKLQCGKNINLIELLKNIDHPLTNYLRINNLIRRENICNFWKNISEIPNITNYDSISNIALKKIEILVYTLIKLFYVIDKKSSRIQCEDKKIFISLENRDKTFDLNYSPNEIYKKIYEYKNVCINLLPCKISPDFFIIICHLLNTDPQLITNLNRDDISKIINEFDNQNILNRYNYKEISTKIINKIGDLNKKKL